MNSKWTDAGKVLILKTDIKNIGLNWPDTSAPTNPEEGQQWYKTDDNEPRWYNGSAWETVEEWAMATGTKMLFKQSSAPNAWTVDDGIQDNSMVVYRTSGNYGADGGSQDPTSLTTGTQRLDIYQDDLTNKADSAQVCSSAQGQPLYTMTTGATTMDTFRDTVDTTTLTPYYTHIIVATKD